MESNTIFYQANSLQIRPNSHLRARQVFDPLFWPNFGLIRFVELLPGFADEG